MKYESQPLVEVLLSEKHMTGSILQMHAVCEITLLIRNVILVNTGCVSDIILNVRIILLLQTVHTLASPLCFCSTLTCNHQLPTIIIAYK